MKALGALPAWRHAAVGTAVLGTSALGLFGVVGEHHPERFDAKQIIVARAGDDALRIREVVDQDFGDADRHGYERIIPDDFGVPTDVTASSPDAPDDLSVTTLGGVTVIRIGDPDRTITGQHRYVLSYTYPQAHLSGGQLALDLVQADTDVETEQFEVVVTGFVLSNPTCSVGSFGDEEGCELVRDGDVYRATISPLAAGDGVTIGGTITDTTDVADVATPDIPERRQSSSNAPLAAGMAALGAGTAGGIYALARRRGRNEVYTGGAVEAAYGPSRVDVEPPPGFPAPATPAQDDVGAGSPLPPPTVPPAASAPAGAVRLVADDDLAGLATIEFVPPPRLQPWEGAAVLTEQLDNDTVSAWFSGLVARDVLTIEKTGTKDVDVVLRPGPQLPRATPDERSLVQQLFVGRDEVHLGTYDKTFAEVWSDVRRQQALRLRGSGWWKRSPSFSALGSATHLAPVTLLAVMVIIGALVLSAAGSGRAFGTPLAALLLAIAVAAGAAMAAYLTLVPARSAPGSAAALRTESFRRFLTASEGRHVDWAWKHGLLREYSAWAVALGAADAWERALAQSSVPPTTWDVSGPLLFYSMAPTIGRTHVAPSSSGGGGFGGGGFSGGSVGGGGGGGSSGSW